MSDVGALFPATRLQRFIISISDGPFGSSLTSDHYSDSGARVVRLGNIGSATFRDFDAAYIPMSHFHSLRRHEVLPGDLLIAGLGDLGHPVGRACIAPQDLGPAIVKADCFRARLDEKRLTHRFAAWALSSSFGAEQTATLTRGSTRTRINLDVAREIRVPTPPVDEQRRIADFLDAETARMDYIRDARLKQLSALEERLGSGIDAIFHENRRTIKTRVKFLLTMKPRYGVLVPEFTDEGVPLIRIGDLSDLSARISDLVRIPEKLSRQYSRTVVRENDILVSVVGTLGKAIVAPAAAAGANVNRPIAVLRTKPNFDGRLLATWLTSPDFLRQAMLATGNDSAQRTLGMEDLCNIELRWPSDETRQKEMVTEVRSLRSNLDSLRVALSQQMSRLNERRQALITAAVTGQFDVTTGREADLS